jgi:hypothetical protein
VKKWLYPAVFLAAAILSRLPHPAVDIARLDPVRSVYLYMDGAELTIETDSGDSGTGADLEAAYAALRTNAHREIFLDTAEFLILDPDVPITEAFYELLRPTTKVVFSNEKPNLETISDYLTIHPPEITLAKLRSINSAFR